MTSNVRTLGLGVVPLVAAAVLSGAVVVGCLSEFAVLGFAARRLGYSLWPDWSGWREKTVAVRAQYFPLLLGTLIVAGCGLVDQAVAGSLGSGSVAALSYGVKYAGVLIAIGLRIDHRRGKMTVCKFGG